MGSACFKLYRKQLHTTIALRKWNKTSFGHCQSMILDISAKLVQIQSLSATKANVTLEANLLNELNGWLLHNETVWKQKSRENWLKEGDRNSRFFHLSAIIRRKRNAVDAIKGDDGTWIINKEDIKEFVVEKFHQIFTEEPILFPADLENLITSSISPSANDSLYLIPSPKEIKDALFGMQSLKAPGLDGLSPFFLQAILVNCG